MGDKSFLQPANTEIDKISARCSICGEVKESKYMVKDSKSKKGFRNVCKNCHNLNNKKYREENKHYFSEYLSEYRLKNPNYMKMWYKENKEDIDRKRNEKRKKDKEQRAVSDKIWREKNRERYNKNYSEYIKKRSELDFNFKMRLKLRNSIYKRIKSFNSKKSYKTIDLIGCSVSYLIKFLEDKFKPGMSWDNYGTAWHIDHIRPCSLFNLKDPWDQKQCFNYTNLQPLWAVDNLKKGNSYG